MNATQLRTLRFGAMWIMTLIVLGIVLAGTSYGSPSASAPLSSSVRDTAASAASALRTQAGSDREAAEFVAGAHRTNAHVSLPHDCRAMMAIPAYTLKINKHDAPARVQSGKRLVLAAIISSDTRTDLKIQCKQLMIQYGADLVWSNEHPGSMRLS